MAQWIARRTSNPEAVGSSPTRGTYFNGIIQDNRTQHIGYTFKITYCARNHAALGHIILSILLLIIPLFARAHYFHFFIIKLYN